jgi:ATP-dependent Zn protease
LASDINAGLVQKVDVKGDDLTITYSTSTGSTTEAVIKTSKKEEGVGLTQTLANYKVAEDKLNLVSINILDESDFKYWFLNISLFVLPLLLIGVFGWMLLKQMKGSGVQLLLLSIKSKNYSSD